MDSLLRDIRYGLKLLWREKAFSLTVLLTLAVCVGANVAVFGVVNPVLLEPLPYDRPERLVTVFNSYPGAGAERASTGSFDYFARREAVDAFEEVALYQGSGSTVGDAGGVDRVRSLRVTPSFFEVVGVGAELGRTFGEEQLDPGSGDEVILSHTEWMERFGGTPDVVGRSLRIDGRPHTVVGVMPESFRVAGREDTRLILPISFGPDERTVQSWHNNNYSMLARLRPGASVERARSQIDALNASLVEEWPVPNGPQLLADVGFHTRVVDARADMVRDVRGVLYLLWAGVGFVLLIGCVNIANLVMARSQVRMGELATRLSLGAGRATVARQLVTEALIMASLGGLLGIGLGALGIDLISSLGAESLPRSAEIGIGVEVVLFTGLLVLVTGLLIGALPALQVGRAGLSSVFRAESRTGTATRRAVGLRGALVSAQVALAFILLSGAGLMLLSFRAAVAVDPGFEPGAVLTGAVSLPDVRYEDRDERRRFVTRLTTGLEAVPGVTGAAVTSQLPFTGSFSSSVIMPEGYEPRAGESLLSPFQTWVSPGYFEAMGIDLLEGRVFRDADREDQPPVIVIDEWLARRYWPDRSPIGQRMLWGAIPGMDEVDESDFYTVVGVVETVKQRSLTDGEHVGAYYFPYAQDPSASYLQVVVAADGGPTEVTSPVREVVQSLDAEMPLYDVRTMEERISGSLATRRAPMVLLGIFAGVALLLAVVGLYGSLAYTVSQRIREMGIRMALGSTPEGIFGLVVGQGMRVTALGMVLGVAGALLLTRLVDSLLYATRPNDPALLGAVAAGLLLVGAVACAVPAWRATRTAPTAALNRR